jgi:outer membrane protein assembly factor BamB
MKKIIYLCLILVVAPMKLKSQEIAQWRGPHRSGVYNETNLLKKWPAEGPELLWSVDKLGKGLSSVSVYKNVIYITGKKEKFDYITALGKNGKIKWQKQYGLSWDKSYPASRCTPTIENNKIYVISGKGEIVCLDAQNGDIKWSVDGFNKFEGKQGLFGIAESPLLFENKVFFTAGGDRTTIVALDKNNGNTVWESKSIQDSTAYVSPLLINHGNKNIFVNITANYLFGVNQTDGEILWKTKYSDIDPPLWDPAAPILNATTPVFENGYLYITSGYDHVGVMFKLSPDASNITRVWTDTTLDNHIGGVVLVNGYIYGASWIEHRFGNWCCLDIKTGKVMYEKKWECKGSIISADGMLYCYEEKRGNLALVKASPEDFKIISSFRIKQGSGPHWAHPVINNGVLYIRHGEVLMAYDIRN